MTASSRRLCPAPRSLESGGFVSRLASVMIVAPANAANRAAMATKTCHPGRVSRSA
jgi:hypothetical protein